MEENDSEQDYVNRCLKALVAKAPKWQLKEPNALDLAIRRKAKLMYAKYSSSASIAAAAKATAARGSVPATPEDGEMEDVADAQQNNNNNRMTSQPATPNESAAEDDEDGEIEDDATSNPGDAMKRKIPPRRKAAPTKRMPNKMVARKKQPAIKGGRGGRGGMTTRAKRGGRGGKK